MMYHYDVWCDLWEDISETNEFKERGGVGWDNCMPAGVCENQQEGFPEISIATTPVSSCPLAPPPHTPSSTPQGKGRQHRLQQAPHNYT